MSIRTAWICLAGVAVASSVATAQVTYTDPAGDGPLVGVGGGILDILQMEVSNTATDISFKFTLGADVVATDWGKYMIAIDKIGGGDTTGNGWGRPISMPAGMDNWFGTWVDSGNGVQSFAYTGSWNMIAANGPFAGPGGSAASSPDVSVSKALNTVTITASLASLGLVPGNTIFFDAFTSGGGGGDSAVDSLANPNPSVANWGDPYAFGPGTANPERSYTIAVPAPAAVGLLGATGLVALRRRR